MPKTGGTFIRNFLLTRGLKTTIGHTPAEKVDAREPGKYRYFGSVRDPWTWYTSWYHHCKRSNQATSRLDLYGDDFDSIVHGVMAKKVKDKDFAIVTCSKDLDAWLAWDGGLYSFWFDYMYGDVVKDFVDTAQLYEGLSEVTGLPVDPHEFPPRNQSKGMLDSYKRPDTMYTQELIDLVWEYDGPLARKLGFTPFSPSSLGPVIRL